ncbi:MAG: hypothetical protein ACLUEQ_08905 [Cloacibacillus evryensis]
MGEVKQEIRRGDLRCNTVPPEMIKSIRDTDATLMAAITSKAGEGLQVRHPSDASAL